MPTKSYEPRTYRTRMARPGLAGFQVAVKETDLWVLAARDFYKIQNEDLLVVCDDLNLPVAKLRIRSGGSAGGQKGLEDIIRRLGSDQFPRLRIGVGTPPEGWDWANFVLSKFSREESADVELAVARAARAAVAWAREGIDACMNQYN